VTDKPEDKPVVKPDPQPPTRENPIRELRKISESEDRSGGHKPDNDRQKPPKK
jgi:hypothetical protein